MKSDQQFIHDRSKEILFFVQEQYAKYKDKCSPADWNRVLDRVAHELNSAAPVILPVPYDG